MISLIKNSLELFNEAKLIGKYLIGEEINDNLCHDYVRAINIKNEKEDKTQVLLNNSLKANWKLKFYDSAYAFTKNKTTIRRKIFIMLAIIEASPNHYEYFIESEKSFLKVIFSILSQSVSIIFSFAFGKILLFLHK